jgi:predicted deacylase
MIRPDPDFPASFAQARERFLAAARTRGARVVSYDNPAGPGLDGEALATDVAVLGAADARHVLLLQSGTHGVEGYCGSGVQHALLREGSAIDAALAAGARVVMLHAINPWGFSWRRRVTEDNVDLNRNVRPFPVPEGPDVDYEAIHDLLLPAQWPPTEANEAAIAAFIAQRGAAHFQFASSHGQWSRADGLFYCGRAPTRSQHTLREVLRREVRGAASLHWIDVHTGLGPEGHGELIYAGRDDTADLARTRACWGPSVTSIYDGSSTSTKIGGMVSNAFYDECPGTALTAVALEYGTVSFDEVRDALRFDHWVAIHAPGDATARAQSRERMLRTFFVDTDGWKAAILAQGRDAVAKATASISAG